MKDQTCSRYQNNLMINHAKLYPHKQFLSIMAIFRNKYYIAFHYTQVPVAVLIFLLHSQAVRPVGKYVASMHKIYYVCV